MVKPFEKGFMKDDLTDQNDEILIALEIISWQLDELIKRFSPVIKEWDVTEDGVGSTATEVEAITTSDPIKTDYGGIGDDYAKTS